MANQLAGALSPYLLAHQDDPVDWLPWGDQAFAKARALDRPILLSVGYAACHWCHVMHDESFVDRELAAEVNRTTVPVKVDREELPDVDQAYQSVSLAVTGQGGWPLTVFLTPDLRPFYIGTYLPRTSRFGRPGLSEVLRAIEEAWRDHRSDLEQVAGEWAALAAGPRTQPAPPPPDALQAAGDALAARYDREHGGFGDAPKFPTPAHLCALLRLHLRDEGERPLAMLRDTLLAMARGGVYDQIGGGFHRYSVDRAWRVPHFEKMLYDNALLVPLYIAAWQATGEEALRGTAEDTIRYMLRELRGPEGGFYSSQDADSPGGEGAFYTFTADEIWQAVGDQAPMVLAHYGVGDPLSRVEGRSVLRIADRADEIASRFAVDPSEVRSRLAQARERLLALRALREPPATDEKVLTGWNGLAITALARAAMALDDDGYLRAARETADFLLGAMRSEGGLLRRYFHGQAGIQGYLEDYAYLAEGLLWLYEASLEESYLEVAVGLAREMRARFWDSASGAMQTAGGGALSPLGPQQEPFDGALVSPQSVALRVALMLSGIAPDLGAEAMAESALAAHGDLLRRAPLAAVSLAEVQDLARRGVAELTLVGPASDPTIGAWHGEICRLLVLDLLLTRIDAPRDAPLWRGKVERDGHPTVYACRGASCAPAHTKLEPALAWLSAHR